MVKKICVNVSLISVEGNNCAEGVFCIENTIRIDPKQTNHREKVLQLGTGDVS